MDVEPSLRRRLVGISVTCHVSPLHASGFTLGGGISLLGRFLGLGCDQLLGLEMVTAAGELIVASKGEPVGLSCHAQKVFLSPHGCLPATSLGWLPLPTRLRNGCPATA